MLQGRRASVLTMSALTVLGATLGCGGHSVVESEPTLIYGTDNRVDVIDATASQKTWARSTVALVKKADLGATRDRKSTRLNSSH